MHANHAAELPHCLLDLSPLHHRFLVRVLEPPRTLIVGILSDDVGCYPEAVVGAKRK